MDAANNSNTSVKEYMDMPVLRFYDIWQAICAVCERRAKAMQERKSSKGPRPKRRRR